jgi:hypothetical protein
MPLRPVVSAAESKRFDTAAVATLTALIPCRDIQRKTKCDGTKPVCGPCSGSGRHEEVR